MERLGKYTLLRRLNSGGMAELFLARQTGPGGFEKMVVIKRLLPALAADSQVMRMFVNEARIAARLNHPNIAQIFDLGAVDEQYFIAMEYVNGHDLSDVQARAGEGNTLGYDLIAYIVQRVCAGLEHAHTLADGRGKHIGLVHRDVSPENVLVSYSGEVKLVDFGIAKATSMFAETQAGLLKGKFGYMSPEQCRSEELDSRSDLFSLGIILYELVCRRRLFRRQSDFVTMRAVLQDPVPPPSAVVDDVPDGLEEVILKALERDVGRRFQTAQEMQNALEKVVRQEGWTAGPANAAAYLASLFPLEQQLAAESELTDGDEPTLGSLPGLSQSDLECTVASPTGRPRGAANEVASVELEVMTSLAAMNDFPEVVESARPEPSWKDPSAEPLRPMSTGAQPLTWSTDPVPPGALPLADGGPGSAVVPPAPPPRPVWMVEPRPVPPPRGSLVLYVVVPALLLLAAGAVVAAFLLRSAAGASYPVQVSSDPVGASIYVDGQKHFGATPLTLHGLTRDREHNLLLVMEGFRPWHHRLVLDGSPASREVKVRLERAGPGGAPGSLALEANVADAEVFLDGEAQEGKLPAVLERVRSGEPHTLLIRKDGYQDETVQVAPLAPGERRRLEITLKPAGGSGGRAPREKPAPTKDPATKSGATRSEPGVATPRHTPSLQSPAEKKIGEHLPH